jgi:hypothetical protein
VFLIFLRDGSRNKDYIVDDNQNSMFIFIVILFLLQRRIKPFPIVIKLAVILTVCFHLSLRNLGQMIDSPMLSAYKMEGFYGWESIRNKDLCKVEINNFSQT